MPLAASVIAEGEGRHHLNAALTLAMDSHYETVPGYVSHWLIDQGGLAFGWHADCKGLPLPYPMIREEVVSFILSWIDKVPFPKEPDIDGSCEKGWKVRSIDYFDSNRYMMFWVAPVWIEYHK